MKRADWQSIVDDISHRGDATGRVLVVVIDNLAALTHSDALVV